jgi:hypothetical protein
MLNRDPEHVGRQEGLLAGAGTVTKNSAAPNFNVMNVENVINVINECGK